MLTAENSEDSNYPGISVSLQGKDVNDSFGKEKMYICWIEFSVIDNELRVVVYADGNEEEYTDLIKIKNIRKRDKSED